MKYKYIKDALDFFKDNDKFNLFEQRYSKNRLFLNQQFNIKYNKKRILAVYDFADSPYTADICMFILNAEIERRRYGLDKIDLIFITNDKFPCNPNYQVIDNAKQLIYNFAIEFTRMFSFIGSISILDNRNIANDMIKNMKNQFKIFPNDYNIKYPFERLIDLHTASYYATNYAQYVKADSSLNCLNPPTDQIKLARKWLLRNASPKIPITITLRETTHVQEARNSDVKAWQDLIDYYKNDNRFIFIIIRDYYKVYKEDILVGSNIIYCNEAIMSFSFRFAIYKLTTLNLGVTGGPTFVSFLCNDINFILFKLITHAPGCVDQAFYKSYYGFEIGDNWYNATKYQKFVWEDDTFEVLQRETDSMLRLLEEDGKLCPDCYDQKFEYSEERIKINHEIYKQESLISKRTPLKYYVIVFRILEFIKKKFKIGVYKSIDEIHLKQNHKIIFYGAGTVTQELIKKYKGNVIGVIDKNYTKLENKMIDGVSIFSIKSLEELSFDYIIITPKLREYTIINELKQTFDIKDKKFLLGSKYD
jgi:hypothetical protein